MHGGGVHLHGIVVLHRRNVFLLDPVRCGSEGAGEIATRLWRFGRRFMGLIADGEQVGLMRLAVVLNPYQRARVARQLQGFSHHQRQRLAAVEHLVVVERAERRAFGGIVVFVGLVVAGDGRAVLVGQHQHHTGQRLGFTAVDVAHASTGDGARHHTAMQQVRRAEIGGVTGLAGDLERTIDAIQRLADR